MTVRALILAAGKGTRMRSRHPKVLQPLGGRPLLDHVIRAARAVPVDQVGIVIGHGAEAVKQAFSDQAGLHWMVQTAQLGTGHAVQQAVDWFEDEDTVLILYGDVPLIRPDTLRQLIRAITDETPLALLTVHVERPTGYGRIVRNEQGRIQRIVEEKDATPEERALSEINSGLMAVRGASLKRWLGRLRNDNAQGEYYLTDIIAQCVEEGHAVMSVQPDSPVEVEGVNDRLQLARLERAWQRQQAEALMREGVMLLDPDRIDIRGTVEAGRDVVLDVNVVLEGHVVLEEGVWIGAHCVLRDVHLGAGTVVHPFSHLEGVRTKETVQIGPHARLRPGTRLAEKVRVGNFVEIKNAQVGTGSKINHLAYVGDATVGQEVNIGAGVITCNYDGANKHRTVIGDHAFIGSDTQLVAPVEVGEGATIGAGSTITRDAPAGELTLSRARQMTVKGWQRPKKKDKA